MNRKRASLVFLLAFTVCLGAALEQKLTGGLIRLEAAPAATTARIGSGHSLTVSGPGASLEGQMSGLSGQLSNQLNNRLSGLLSGTPGISQRHDWGGRIGSSAGKWMRSLGENIDSGDHQPENHEGVALPSSDGSSMEPSLKQDSLSPSTDSPVDIPEAGGMDRPSSELIEEFAQAGALAIPGFNEQVEQWIDELSAESEFQAWPNADREVLPLGPGLHGWVVLLSAEDKPIGYMVVGATEDGGYRLLEYGSGSKPLYSVETLYDTLVRNEIVDANTVGHDWPGSALAHLQLERIYTNGLQAIWKVTLNGEQYAVDAKSGELLPPSVLTTEAVEQQDPLLSPLSELVNGFSKPAEDPLLYAYWMNPQHSAIEERSEDFPGWMNTVRSEETTYVVKRFAGQVLSPYALDGYHLWANADQDEVLFLSIDQEGSRYLPLALLSKHGQFFSAP